MAIIAGLLGAALALTTPFLPVKQTTAELNWPQNGVLQSVNAPLIGYVATDLSISVPCSAAAGLAGPQNAGKTVLLSTVPKQSPKAIDRGLLIERVNNDLLVIVRNTPVVSAPLSQVLSPACERLTFTAYADKVTGEFVGLVTGPQTDDPGQPLRGERSGYDFRPQIVGVFTDLAGPAPPGYDVLGDPGFSLQHFADAAEADRDDRRAGDDGASRLAPCTCSTPPTACGTDASFHRDGGRSGHWTCSSSPFWCGGTSSAPTPPTTATS